MTPLQAIRARSTERELRALTRLADGASRESDRAAFESYAARTPGAVRELDRQQLLVKALRAGGPRVSDELRRHLDAEMERHSAGQRRKRPRWSPASLRPAMATACVVLAAVIGVGTWRVVEGGGKAPLTIDWVAMLATRTPTAAPPPPDANTPSELRGQFEGARFPTYAGEFGARASGQRTDATEGRTIRTVYYRLRNDATVSYSVVSGAPLTPPASMRQMTVAGSPIRVASDDHLSYVTFVRYGRTCVLAGAVSPDTLTTLAGSPSHT